MKKQETITKKSPWHTNMYETEIGATVNKGFTQWDSWWTLMKNGVSIKYTDMYDRKVANIRTCGNLTYDFSIKTGLHKDLH